MRTIQWPAYGVTRVEVFRVLDLSGLCNTPRKSKLFIKAGYVFVDGVLVSNIKDTIEIGKPVLLSIRLPTNITIEDTVMVVSRQYYEGTPRRRVF